VDYDSAIAESEFASGCGPLLLIFAAPGIITSLPVLTLIYNNVAATLADCGFLKNFGIISAYLMPGTCD
jgi:hypothetical protein